MKTLRITLNSIHVEMFKEIQRKNRRIKDLEAYIVDRIELEYAKLTK
jgi:hypothetical protein